MSMERTTVKRVLSVVMLLIALLIAGLALSPDQPPKGVKKAIQTLNNIETEQVRTENQIKTATERGLEDVGKVEHESRTTDQIVADLLALLERQGQRNANPDSD